jgi:hypothetical protein
MAYEVTHKLVFSSPKTLTKEVLFYMMKCTLEEFVLPYVNAIVFVV